MKKLMTIGMAAVMATGFASAQNDVVMVGQAPANDPAETKVTAEVALVSSYVWRGQVLNNDFVLQPQLTASQYGVSLNIWANYDLGKNHAGINNDFSEMDFSLAYTLPLDLNDVSFDVGIISYNFPANGTDVDTGGDEISVNAPSTTELFAAAHWLTFRDYVIPSVTMFGDIDQADGVYILFDVVAPYQVSDYLWVEGGVSAGWGNTSYNDYYWGTTVPAGNGGNVDKGFNDFNFYANASYELLDNLTASVNATFTLLNGGAIRDAAKLRYEDENKFWAGVNLAYDF
ncbi:MAG: TorF family putative porin [Verrucomicrobiota bacterium]|nr:TorF family putative porin [Verrucomicrobiota bacterium]